MSEKYIYVCGIKARNPNYRELGALYYKNLVWYLIRLYVPHLDNSRDNVCYDFVDDLYERNIL